MRRSVFTFATLALAAGCLSEPSPSFPFHQRSTFVLRTIDGHPVPTQAWGGEQVIVADTLVFEPLRRLDPSADVSEALVVAAGDEVTPSTTVYPYFVRDDSVFVHSCPRNVFCAAIVDAIRAGAFDGETIWLRGSPFQSEVVWVYERVR